MLLFHFPLFPSISLSSLYFRYFNLFHDNANSLLLICFIKMLFIFFSCLEDKQTYGFKATFIDQN